MRHHPSCWNQVLAKLGFRRVSRPQKRQAAFGGRLSRIEALESRQLLSVTVDTLVDVTDANDGRTSLREAIAAAPANGSVVNFHQSLHGGAIELSGQLIVSQALTITGPGADKLTIDARGNGRAFHVQAPTGLTTISGLTITGGGNAESGGGVLNDGNLLLSGVIVTGNKVTHFGGGVHTTGNSLRIDDSIISENVAAWGGGIASSLAVGETIIVERAAILNNTAHNWNGGSPNGSGGGFFVGGTSSLATNHLKLLNATVGGNKADQHGGGLSLSAGATAQIVNSTIAYNEATSGPEGGGGVHVSSALSGSIQLQNTIIAKNTAPAVPWLGDMYGWKTSGQTAPILTSQSTYNLIGMNQSSMGLPSGNNLYGPYLDPLDPQLTRLASIAGATPTYSLSPTSPAIDAGSTSHAATAGLAVDARGSARTIDLPKNNGTGGATDVGAIETDVRIGAGDFNGDGREDELRYSAALKSLIVAEKTATEIGWEVGAWGSLAMAMIPSPTSFNGTIIGDFNGDGRDDVMVLDVATYKWWIGISDGTLFHVTELRNGDGPFTAGWEYVYVGDFDSDGNEELLGRVSGQWLTVEYNVATGGTNAAFVNANFAPGTQAFAQDVNRDGRTDLITRASGTAPWMVTLSQGVPGAPHQFATATDMNAWVSYGYNSATGKLDADKAMAKVIEEFAWVYNNVELELYPGLMKGPTATEQTKAGSDWDQAALLEERLQALGLGDVKIASGKVRASVGQIRAWLGLKDSVSAADVWTILRSSIDDKAQLADASTSIEFTHAWVQAYLPTATGLSLLDLDPSWKFKDRQAGIPLATELNSVHAEQSPGVFDEFSYLALNPTNNRSLPIEFFEDQVMGWLASNTARQGNSLAEVPYDGPIKRKAFETLPVGFSDGMSLASTPGVVQYDDFNTISTDSLLSSQLTHRVTISLKKNSETTAHWTHDLVVPSHSLDTIEITFGASSATGVLTDPNNIATAGPFYSRLVVNGNVVKWAAANESFSANDAVKIELLHRAPTHLAPALEEGDPGYIAPSDPNYVGPTSYDRRIKFTEKPGTILSYGLEANQYSRDSLAELQAAVLAAVAGDTTEGQLVQDIDLLSSYAIAKYWHDYQAQNDAIAGLMGAIGHQQWVGSGRIASKPSLLLDPNGGAGDVVIDYLAFGMAPVDFGIDLPNSNNGVYDAATGQFHSEAWQLIGYNSSALEHNIVEEITSAGSVSTIKGLQRASQQNLGVSIPGDSTPAVTDDVISVFESRPGVDDARNVYHVYNIRVGSPNAVEVISPLGGQLMNASSLSNLLSSHNHNSATQIDDTLWAFLSNQQVNQVGPLDGVTKVVKAMATKHRTKVDSWTGSVYLTEIPGRSMQFAIQADGGGPTNGGFSGGLPQAPPPELPSGSFTYAGYAGDPVHTSNGNMFRDETDIVFPNIGVPLTFTRHYDSQTKDEVGMGVGWTYSFSDMLQLDEKGTTGPGNDSDDEIVWVASTGARHRFKKLTSSTFATPPELKGTLTRLVTDEYVPGGAKYLYLDASGMEYHFQAISITPEPVGSNTPHTWVGRLRMQRDAQGNGVQVEYAQPDNGHAFTNVHDIHDSTRRLFFSYGAVDRIVSITKYDGSATPIPMWGYNYTDVSGVTSSSKRLSGVTTPNVDVMNAAYAESNSPTTTLYDYYNNAVGDPAYAKGMIKQITEPDGSWHFYEYYRNGRVFRVKQGELGQTPATVGIDVQTFSYNLFKNSTEFVDERGNIETYFHQKNGLQEKQIHADRSQTKATWGTIGAWNEFLMASTTDERGAVENLTYYNTSSVPGSEFKHQQLYETTAKHYPNQTGLVTRYDYVRPNAAGKPHLVAPSTTIVDPNAPAAPGAEYYAGQPLTTTSSYYNFGDSLGKLWKTTDAAGKVFEYSYYPSDDIVPDDGDFVPSNRIYRRGLLQSIKQPPILDPQDPEGIDTVTYETVFDYYPAGNVRKSTTRNAVTLQIVSVSTFLYDSSGNVTQTIVGANAIAERVVTESVYDVLGRLRETGFADANATIDPYDAYASQYKYDKSGRVRESVDPLGRVTRFEYDRQGNLLKQINPDGTLVLHEYDAFGNRVATTDGLKRITRFVYDDRNRLIQTILPGGAIERLRYDGAGNVIAKIDVLGNATTFRYDAAGRLLETKLPDPDGPNDEDGDGTNLTSPTTTNKYDKLGNLIESIDPEANVTQFKYDKLGRVVQTQTLKGVNGDRNATTPWVVTGTLQSLATIDYDAAGNVIEKATYDVSQYDAAATATLLAAPRAQQDLAPSKVQVVSLRYDAFGRPVKTINADNTATRTTYDAAGRIRYQYDEANSVTEYVYDAFGRLEKTKLPDPTTGAITSASPTTTYQYDVAGNRIAVTDARGFTTRLEYDVFNRLIAATNPLGGRTRSLCDVTGQLIATADELGRTVYSKLDERGRAVLELSADPDGAGPQLPSANRFVYDDGRLIEQIDPRGYSTTYSYDRLGRVTKERSIISEVVDDLNATTSPQFFVDNLSARAYGLDSKAIGGDSTTLSGSGANQVSATWVFPSLPAGNYRVAFTWSTPGTVSAATVGLALDNFNSPPVPAKYYSGINQTTLPNDFYRDHAGAMTAWEETKFGNDQYYVIAPTQAGLNLLVRLIAPAGSVLRIDAVRIERVVEQKFSYDANGNVTQSTDELGRATVYEFDELGRLATTTLPDPDGASLLPSPRTTRFYDGYDNLVKTVERNAISGAGAATDDVITTYAYDARNRLEVEIVDVGVDVYDSSTGLKTIDYINRKTVFDYDDVGNLEFKREFGENPTISGQLDLLRTTEYQYDKLGRLTRETLNSDGNAVTASTEQVTLTTYDSNSNVQTRTETAEVAGGAAALTTTYAYDALNRVVSEGAAGSSQLRRTRYRYDAVGNRTETIDPLGRMSRTEFDRLDRVVKSTSADPDGAGLKLPETNTFAYDATGNLVAETNGANETQRFAYDSRGLSVWSRDGRGDETIRRYDAVGNLERLVDPALNLTTYAYDGLDRKKSETTSSGTRTWEYNALGQVEYSTDRNLRAERYYYDRVGRKTQEKWYLDRTAASSHQGFYDQLLWYYDGLGRLIEDRYLHYSAPNSLEYRVTRSYQYDGLDRLTELSNQSLLDNPSQRSATVGVGPTPETRQAYAYSYDATGAVETRQQFLAGQFAASTKSTYNAFGELVRQEDKETSSAGVASATLDFESTDAVFSYFGDGSLASTTRYTDWDGTPAASGHRNLVRTNYAYDEAGRLKNIAHSQARRAAAANAWPGATPLVDFAYGYDAAGRVSSIGTNWNTNLPAFSTRTDETQAFDFDDAGQLTYVDSNLAGANASYVYGANGNRALSTEQGLTQYAYQADNRVLGDQTYGYEYDDEGNLTRRTSATDATDYEAYAWDHRNRLTKVERYVNAALAETIAYRYNASGDLVYRGVTPSGQTTQYEHYLVDSGQRTMAFEQDGDVKRRYQYGPTGEVLFDQVFNHTVTTQLQPEADLLIPLGDHQHSTRVVLAHTTNPTDALNDVVYVRQSLDYAQFGRTTTTLDATGLADAGGSITIFGHHGSIADAATGLQLKGERWYSPDLGRFVSEDPIQDGANWYMFAGNDPVNYADPSGLSMQGHPLGGGFSGNKPVNSTIGSGSITANNLFGGAPLSSSLNNFIKGSISQSLKPTSFPSTTFGGFVDANRGQQILGLGPISTPTVAPRPTSSSPSIHDFNLAKEPSLLGYAYRPTTQPPQAPSLHQIMEGYFNSYADNPSFRGAVDDYFADQQAIHAINHGNWWEAGRGQLAMSLNHAAGSALPGVGEYQDYEMLADRNSTASQRMWAAGSLALSILTIGESPNASAARRAVGSVDTHTLREIISANKHTQEISIFANGNHYSQIDVFADFNAPITSAQLRPYGGPGGGHHIPAKSAFEGAPGYDANAAPAIPNPELARLGLVHSTVSGAQQTLYRAFAKTGESLTWDVLKAIEAQALVRSGMNTNAAQSTVEQAVKALKDAGVPGPTRIPWRK